MLKDEEEYLSSKNCFRMGRFSSVGLQGNDAGEGGGRSRLWQEHGFSPGRTTPELVQVGKFDCWVVLAATSIMGGILGNCSSTMCRAFRVLRDR
jgi:hypothetical protein